MTASPRIGLALTLAAAKGDRTWHQDVGFVAKMLEALEAEALWSDFSQMNLGEDNVALDRKKLAAAARAWKTGTLELLAGGSADDAYASVQTAGIVAQLRLQTPPVDDEAVVDHLIAWARTAGAIAGDRARVQLGCLYPVDVSYPPRRPPLTHPHVRFGTLVDFVGLTFCRGAMPDAVDAVVRGKLPKGATRTVDGDLVVLRWVGDAGDPVEQARACIRQEDWWAKTVSAEPESGWNAAGDQWILPSELARKPPFTLYDADEKAGYRAVVVLPDGELDGATWQDIARLTAMRELPDGSKVEKVRLIVPIREDAIAIADRARALGVDAVVYKDDDDTLWNVMPPGTWRPIGVADAPGALSLPQGTAAPNKARARKPRRKS